MLLVSQKLYSVYSISSECLKDKKLALSLNQLEPVSFNDIDPNYINKHRDSIVIETISNKEISSCSDDSKTK